MKIWKIQMIEDNKLKTYIIIAESKEEALDCLERSLGREELLDPNVLIIEELSTARPADSKVVYMHESVN